MALKFRSTGLLLTALFGSQAMQAAPAAEGFEYHGYMRVGTGMSKSQTENACYGLASTTGNPFRLGNECGFYMENIFNYNFQKQEADKPWFRMGLNLTMMSDNLQNFESSDNGDFRLINREVYVEGGNVVSEGSVLWIGKRFYKRRDVGMFDLFLVETNGVGAGIYDVSAGPGKFHAAYAQYRAGGDILVGGGTPATPTTPAVPATASSPLVSTIDLRYDLPIGKDNLETILLFGTKSEKPSLGEANVEYEKVSGAELTLIYTGNYSDALNNRAFLQYGNGLFGTSVASGTLLNGFESSASTVVKNTATSSEQIDLIKKSSTFRVADELVYNAEAWEAAFGLVYHIEDFGGQKLSPVTAGGAVEDAENRSVLLVGARPSYYLSKIWKLTLDAGYANVANNVNQAGNGQEDSTLTKETIALQVQPDHGYSARPSLRFFVTQAQWDMKSQPYLNTNSEIYLTSKQGSTFGVQAEAWW